MGKTIIFITLIAVINQSLAVPFYPESRQLNDQRLMAIPIDHVIEARKIDTTNIDLSTLTTQLQHEQQQTRIFSDTIIHNLMSAIDLSPIMDYLNKISLGKLLTAIYKKVFPNGIKQKLSELICKHFGNKSLVSETESLVVETPVNTFKERIVDVPPPNMNKNTFLLDVVYPEELIELDRENLKQTPLTDDYIEDEPVVDVRNDDEIKTKINGDYSNNGIELLTNERFSEVDGREFLRKLIFS